jgi:hypothetical protein
MVKRSKSSRAAVRRAQRQHAAYVPPDSDSDTPMPPLVDHSSSDGASSESSDAESYNSDDSEHVISGQELADIQSTDTEVQLSDECDDAATAQVARSWSSAFMHPTFATGRRQVYTGDSVRSRQRKKKMLLDAVKAVAVSPLTNYFSPSRPITVEESDQAVSNAEDDDDSDPDDGPDVASIQWTAEFLRPHIEKALALHEKVLVLCFFLQDLFPFPLHCFISRLNRMPRDCVCSRSFA